MSGWAGTHDIGAGTLSSILVATPTLVWLKEREPAVRAQEQKLAAAKAAQDRRAGKMAASVVVGDASGVEDAKPAAAATGAGAPAGPRGPRNQPVRNQPRSKRR